MSANTRRRLPKWLRVLGWLGLVAVTLMFVASVTHRLLWREMHAVAEKARASVRPRPVVAAGKKDAPARKVVTPDELPFVGPALSGDDAAADAFEERFADIGAFFLRKLGGQSPPLDFLQIVRQLGLPVTEGMTEKEAAALFLAETAKFAPLLAEWRADLEKGPWDYGGGTASDRLGVISPTLQVAKLLQLMAGAQWRTGDADGAWRSLETMALMTERMNDGSFVITNLVATSTHALLTNMIADGVLTEGLTDSQLRQLPALVNRFDPFAGAITAVEGETQMLKRTADQLIADPHVREKLYPAPDPNDWLASLQRAATDFFTTPQQIRDTMDLVAGAAARGLDPIDFEARTLRPDAASFHQPLLDGPLDWFGRFYYRYAALWMQRGELRPMSLASAIVQTQSLSDQAALAAQLELEKRATGSYPAALPVNAPHDPATGQPYFYRLTDDGDYELRGAGYNQTDDGGDPKKDIVWPRRTKKKPAASEIAGQ